MPTKSNAPIMASTDAACTSAMPKSLHSGMKCVWMSPFVDRPQTMKVANRIQKTREPEASAKARKALRTALPAGADRRGATAAALSP